MIREFVNEEVQKGKEVKIFEKYSNPLEFFERFNIKVELDKYKNIILQEETKLELGGINKKSFSLIYPTNGLNYIENGKITLIGSEISKFSKPSLDFGMLVLIGSNEITEKDFNNLRQFSLLSDGIEGFLIRSIPRKFWYRISAEVIKKNFSFEFLGNAIMYLYEQKFKDLIESIEILFISSYPESIDELINVTAKLREDINEKWKNKIKKWKKRIDCEYDWLCEECSFYDTCDLVKEVLDARKNIEN